MRRMACVELPRFRLQLLLRAHKEWRNMPVALVSEDRPLAPVLEVNSAADKAGVAPGMKYATALAVVPEVQAGVVSERSVEEAVYELRSVFQRFAPAVEPWGMAEGVFWLDCEGLSRLWSSLYSWAQDVQAAVSACELYSRISVGFSRFATFATAVRGGETAIVIHDSPAHEHTHALDMPVRRLPLDSAGAARLEQLGIRTIRAFSELYAGSIASRFGARAEVLHRFVNDTNELPVQSGEQAQSYCCEQEMPALLNREAIASHLVPALEHLCSLLRSRGKRAAELTVTLRDERGGEYTEVIAPAEPSGDARFLHKLLLLRVYTLRIGARIVYAELAILPARELPGQAMLFNRHDEHGASWAHARSLLQAEFGNEALVRVIPCDAHHPGERFRLVSESTAGLEGTTGFTESPRSSTQRSVGISSGPGQYERNASGSGATPALVRRILFTPQPCSTIPSGLRFGPFRVSGRWWRRESGRSYYYLWRERNRALWLYQEGDRTVLQGYVE